MFKEIIINGFIPKLQQISHTTKVKIAPIHKIVQFLMFHAVATEIQYSQRLQLLRLV